MPDRLTDEGGVEPRVLGPVAQGLHTQLKAQHLEIEQLKDDVTAAKRETDTKKRETDTAADTLQTQVDAQQVEIEQLGADAATQKTSTDACTESLQTQVDGQQTEIVDLTKTVAGQANIIGISLQQRIRDDEKREAYAAYLKAAAEDLRDQFHLERAAHLKLQERLLGVLNIAPPPPPANGPAKTDVIESQG
jgi:hypothetical protein